MTNLKNLLLLGILLGLVLGCSDDHKTKISTPSKKDFKAKRPSNAKVTSFKFNSSYKFSGIDGCSTNKIIVSANNKKEFNKQLCDQLQEGAKNNHCAESDRLKMFLEKCEGSKWKPTETIEGMSIIEKRLEENDIEYKTDKAGSFAVTFIKNNIISTSGFKVTDVELTSDLQVPEFELGLKVVQSLENVKSASPFSLRSKCKWPSSVSSGSNFVFRFWPHLSSYVLIMEIPSIASTPGIQTSGKISPLFIIYSLASPSDILHIEVYQSHYPRGFRSYIEYFSDPISTTKLVKSKAIRSSDCE